MKIDIEDLIGQAIEIGFLLFIRLVGPILFIIWGIKHYLNNSNQWIGLIGSAIVWFVIANYLIIRRRRRRNNLRN